MLGHDPAAQPAADTLVDVVDVRANNCITMADRRRLPVSATTHLKPADDRLSPRIRPSLRRIRPRLIPIRPCPCRIRHFSCLRH